MYTEMALTARRFALTLAVAGIAAMGSVAMAPAASAAQDGPSSVVQQNSGPDAFIVMEHGKKPVFFCDDDKPNQRHNNCVDMTAPTRF